LPDAVSLISSSSSGGGGSAAAAVQACGGPLPACCVGRHLANRNELCVSGYDSYALLFLFAAYSNVT